MKWGHFIHMYQPWWQHPGILEKITNESYRPLIRGFLKIEETKISININSVLTELLFEHGYRDVVDNLRLLVEMGRVDLTGSAKFHAFLPLIPENEIRRQIKLNEETNRKYFGEIYKPKGFFSPEMAYSPKVAKIVEDMGYEWILADEVAVKDQAHATNFDKTYVIQGGSLKVFFREKNPTNVIMSAQVRSAESFKRVVQDRLNSDTYTITAMDAETFGHHRPGHEEVLFDILASPEIDNVFISDLTKFFPEVENVMPKDSTWASSWKDVQEGNPYNYWFNKSNKIHNYEWEMADIAIRAVNQSKYSDEHFPAMFEQYESWVNLTQDQQQEEESKRRWVKARDLLDRALNSDPWWWACAIPWWSIEEIEKGMNSLYKVVLEVPDKEQQDLERIDELYKKILITAHEWQRTGLVDEMRDTDTKTRAIPLSKRFAAEHHYKALLTALKEEEERAASDREYEKAIKWRDSQYKLERDLDIYDAVHVMDVFRTEGNFKRFEEILAQYKEEYRKISKGQPE